MDQITAISKANGYSRPVRTKARTSTTNASIRQSVALRQPTWLITDRSSMRSYGPGLTEADTIADRLGCRYAGARYLNGYLRGQRPLSVTRGSMRFVRRICPSPDVARRR